MNNDYKEILRLILEESKNSIEDAEYNRWYNANTTLSFEEFRSTYNLELIQRITDFLSEHFYTE